ncbi:MAG: type II toxin-antitoxin system VapC family toxin [Chloroflexota bacterium]
MLVAVADTHTAIWYVFNDPRLSASARSTIEEAVANNDRVGVSSITLAEIIYLIEKGRLHPDTLTRVVAAPGRRRSVLTEVPFNRSVALAMRRVLRSAVPDMPDRIIAATALYLGVPVISRDVDIRLSEVPTIW